MIEFRHLRTLCELHDTGSLAAAAERLHLTQSALSHQLKSLETHYGLPLFVRKSRPLRLSPAGERLLELARQVLPELHRADQDLQRLAEGRGGRLYAVIECHSCYEWLLPVLDDYRRDWPEVELDLPGSVSFKALTALREGRVDVVVTSDPVEDEALAQIPFARFEVLLAMAPDHPLAEKSYVLPEDLAGETVITYPVAAERLDVFQRFLRPAGVEPTAWRTSELTLMILVLVKSGRGVSALPAWTLETAAADRLVAARPLGEEGLHSTLYLATRAGEQRQAYVAAFIEAVKRRAETVFGPHAEY
jgi:LysR family transcriptional regulator, regulator for metE and metH